MLFLKNHIKQGKKARSSSLEEMERGELGTFWLQNWRQKWPIVFGSGWQCITVSSTILKWRLWVKIHVRRDKAKNELRDWPNPWIHQRDGAILCLTYFVINLSTTPVLHVTCTFKGNPLVTVLSHSPIHPQACFITEIITSIDQMENIETIFEKHVQTWVIGDALLELIHLDLYQLFFFFYLKSRLCINFQTNVIDKSKYNIFLQLYGSRIIKYSIKWKS